MFLVRPGQIQWIWHLSLLWEQSLFNPDNSTILESSLLKSLFKPDNSTILESSPLKAGRNALVRTFTCHEKKVPLPLMAVLYWADRAKNKGMKRWRYIWKRKSYLSRAILTLPRHFRYGNAMETHCTERKHMSSTLGIVFENLRRALPSSCWSNVYV